ncbi:MAG: four helix bundle protein [Candidatus Omnitrophota bacterium]
MKIQSYKELNVWQKGIELVEQLYIFTKTFPKDEIYGLTNQMRRASLSIPSNIAEGFMRQHTKEFIQFLFISLGSCGELDTQMVVANKLNYIDDETYILASEKLDHISRMIRALIISLRRRRKFINESRTTKHKPQSGDNNG